MIAFILGLVVGAPIGVVSLAALLSARRAPRVCDPRSPEQVAELMFTVSRN